jgi:tellurite resistance protein TerC
MTTLWLGMAGLLLLLVLTDLFIIRPHRREESPLACVGHAVFWLLLAMLFNILVFVFYDRQVFGAGVRDSYTIDVSGTEASLQYLSVFVLELVLGVDSVFIASAVFAHLRVAPSVQHKLLMWGILLAACVRGGLILGVGGLIHTYDWFRFVLAGVLVIAAIRMILIRQENTDPSRNIVIKVLRKLSPMTGDPQRGSLVDIRGGKPALTPLVLPLLLIETGDAFMAMDSIPATFAFTREPFLIFAASCFAMLCIRALIPALTRIKHRLRYFKLGMAMILAYSAVVIALPASRTIAQLAQGGWQLTTLQKLSFVAGAVALGAVVAVLFGAAPSYSTVSPLGEDADRLARGALTRVRKVVVFVIGVTGVALGAVMAIGPGPGIPIVFIALLLLASEFAWARMLVNKYRPRVERVTLKAAEETRRRFSPWLMGLLIAGTIAGAVLVSIVGKIPVPLVIGGAVPMIAGQLFLGYLAYFRKPDLGPTQLPAPPAPEAHSTRDYGP